MYIRFSSLYVWIKRASLWMRSKKWPSWGPYIMITLFWMETLHCNTLIVAGDSISLKTSDCKNLQSLECTRSMVRFFQIALNFGRQHCSREACKSSKWYKHFYSWTRTFDTSRSYDKTSYVTLNQSPGDAILRHRSGHYNTTFPQHLPNYNVLIHWSQVTYGAINWDNTDWGIFVK